MAYYGTISLSDFRKKRKEHQQYTKECKTNRLLNQIAVVNIYIYIDKAVKIDIFRSNFNK